MSFVRAPNPIWYMVDHIGQPLNDEYYAFFLTNTLPYIPQNVYRDPQGMTVWTGDVLQFSPAGTLPDNLYFDPDLVYRIEIRHGNSQTDPLIWEINNFVPTGGGDINSEFAILAMSNQITNPEFQFLNFVSPITITDAGEYNIAPGWDLVLTGVGTTTLTQNILSGNQDQVNNPPYSLRVNNNGWSEAFLRQRFDNNGALWANGAVSMTVTARAQISPQEITLIYSPSLPGVPEVIATGLVGTGDYEVVQGAIDLPASVNTGLSTVAYVDMIIQLPPTGIVDVTCVQVLGQGNPLPTDFDPLTDIPRYQQQTSEREIDHTFNYYKEPLARKPINSYLVGWDFPLNPSQQGTVFSYAGGANSSFYSWDQTIVYQSVNNSMQTSRVTNEYLSVTAALAGQMALIQYLPATQARKLLSDTISVYLDAAALAPGPIPTSIPCTISLWVTDDASLPSTLGSFQSLIATIDANGKPASFHGNWTEIPTITSDDTTFNLQAAPFAFDGWWNVDQNNPLGASATFFAIVIGFGTIPINNSIIFHQVGLQSGGIATPPAPLTYNETLENCQFYYEQSYMPGTAPGTTTNVGLLLNIQNTLVNGGNIAGKPGIFEFEYKTIKNTTPTITIYNPANGASNGVQFTLWNGGTAISSVNANFSANWQVIDTSIYRSSYQPTSYTSLMNPVAAPLSPQAGMLFHYVADSRLGA